MAKKLTKDEQRELRRLEWKQEADKKLREEKFKKYGILALAAFVILAVSFIFWKAASSPTTPADQLVNMPAVTAEDIQTRPKEAKATLVEYSDLQCPACAAYHPLVKQITEEYKGKLNFVYRNFPLENVHPNAFVAAQAAYAAHLQGKFWQMQDILFTKQAEWSNLPDPKQMFVEYAKQLELDSAKFEADFSSETTKEFVETQKNSALSIGVQSTPTFFLDGRMLANPQSYEEFKALIDEALKN